MIGEPVALFTNDEDVWTLQQQQGVPSLAAKLRHEAYELSRSLQSVLYAGGKQPHHRFAVQAMSNIGIVKLCLFSGDVATTQVEIPLSWSSSLILLSCLLDSAYHMWMQALKLKINEGDYTKPPRFDDDFSRLDFFNQKASQYAQKHLPSVKKVDKSVFGIDKSGHRQDWVPLLASIRNRFVHRGVFLLKKELNTMKRCSGQHNNDNAIICIHFLNFVSVRVQKLAESVPL